MTALERFWAKVDKGTDDECWEWQAAKLPKGYGGFYLEGRWTLAHRAAYVLLVAPIPGGMCVCHNCDNPSCVNPAHLYVGTQADNLKDMTDKGRARRVGAKGESNGLAKLSVESVLSIRELRGSKPQKEIAELFGVSRPTVKDVQLRRTWAWVP